MSVSKASRIDVTINDANGSARWIVDDKGNPALIYSDEDILAATDAEQEVESATAKRVEEIILTARAMALQPETEEQRMIGQLLDMLQSVTKKAGMMINRRNRWAEDRPPCSCGSADDQGSHEKGCDTELTYKGHVEAHRYLDERASRLDEALTLLVDSAGPVIGRNVQDNPSDAAHRNLVRAVNNAHATQRLYGDKATYLNRFPF